MVSDAKMTPDFENNVYWPGTKQILKTTSEIADILGVHTNTILRWIKAGKLQCVSTGKRSFYFTYNQIIDFLDNNTVQVKINNKIGEV